MGDFTGIFAIFCVFVAPLWLIMHYASKHRQVQSLTSEDETMLADVWQVATKMENRVKSLESILNTRAPGWRDKA